MANQNHKDHYRPVTAKELATIEEAITIVNYVHGLDGDSDLKKCSETLQLLAENLREGLEGEPE